LRHVVAFFFFFFGGGVPEQGKISCEEVWVELLSKERSVPSRAPIKSTRFLFLEGATAAMMSFGYRHLSNTTLQSGLAKTEDCPS